MSGCSSVPPSCSNCGGSDFVWANDLKTGTMGRGELSLRRGGELSLGTRICRSCGHADLFVKDPTVLRQPHTWRPGEFVPIAAHPPAHGRPSAAPAGPTPMPTSPTPIAPPPVPPPATPPLAAAPPPPPPPPTEPAPTAEPEATPASAPADTAAEGTPKKPRRRTTKSKSASDPPSS